MASPFCITPKSQTSEHVGVGEVAFPFHITLRSQTSEHVGKEEGPSLQLELASPFHILNIKVRTLNMLGRRGWLPHFIFEYYPKVTDLRTC